MAGERTVTVNEELYRQFFEIVGEDKRMNQSRAARELGVSPGLISEYKSRMYISKRKSGPFLNGKSSA
jgi:Mn-dependent DtxR family transcriptional regulator